MAAPEAPMKLRRLTTFTEEFFSDMGFPPHKEQVEMCGLSTVGGEQNNRCCNMAMSTRRQS
jgi:hypothetical protein